MDEREFGQRLLQLAPLLLGGAQQPYFFMPTAFSISTA